GSVRSSFGELPTPAGNHPAGSKQKMCLPPAMRGNVFGFSSEYGSSSRGVPCEQVVNGEVVYDNLQVVDDPTCGHDPAIADPGFESTANTVLGAFAFAS